MADIQLAPPSPRTPDGLVPPAAIDTLAHQIATQFDPERIYLFGSYAYGQPTPDSDVDIMVVMDTADMDMQANRIRQWLRFDYPIDVMVYTPAYFAERLGLGDYFIQEVIEQGHNLYDSGRAIFSHALAHPSVRGPLYEQIGGAYLNKLAAEWVELAEGDYEGADLMLRVTQRYWMVSFHAQQCAEKYLKAFLREHSVKFAKTHELADLLPLCISVDPGFSALQGLIGSLKGYAIDPRYPGHPITLADAQSAFQTITQIRAFVRGKLGI